MSDKTENDDKRDDVDSDVTEQEETETEASAEENSSEEEASAEASSDEGSEDEASSDEGSEDEASAEASSDETAEEEEPAEEEEAPVAASNDDHGHDDHGHDDHHGGHGHDDHGLSHVASAKVLLGTFGALMVLTVITVAATMVDLGSSMNLLVAMLIATVKAGLVSAYFMHLKYDKVMHTVAFFSALLFALLFVSFALMDSSEYQQDIIKVEEAAQ